MRKVPLVHYIWFFLLGVFITFYMVTMGTFCSAAAEGEDAGLTGNECLGVWFVATALMIVPFILLFWMWAGIFWWMSEKM